VSSARQKHTFLLTVALLLPESVVEAVAWGKTTITMKVLCMKSLSIQSGAVDAGLTAGYSFLPSLPHPLPRQTTARLRRKGPLWVALALLVLAADSLLAWLAWVAVDFVLK
jgi:hypothetical protein